MTRPLPKIAYLTGEYPRASDTFIQREVAALRELGHEVLACSIRTTGAEHLVGPEQKAEHARTFKVLHHARNPGRLIASHLRWLRHPRRYWSALRLAAETAPEGIVGKFYQVVYFLEAGVLATELAERSVDHLHNHIAKSSCTVAMLAARMSGLNWSFTIHGPDIFFEPHRWRVDAKVANATFVACISHFCRSQTMCFTDPARWRKLHIVHCGIEPARYDRTEQKQPGKSLLFVGRLAAVKGVRVLIEAVSRLVEAHPDLSLTLVGDGPDRAALESEVARRGLAGSISFTGYRSQDEVAEALTRSDLFVLPSFAEGLPVVLMEAMAARVPVVATRIAGIPELVEDGVHGRLVPPGDVEALTGAVDALLRDPLLRHRAGEAGREKVCREHDIAREAAWLSRLFQASASGEGRRLGLRPQEGMRDAG